MTVDIDLDFEIKHIEEVMEQLAIKNDHRLDALCHMMIEREISRGMWYL